MQPAGNNLSESLSCLLSAAPAAEALSIRAFASCYLQAKPTACFNEVQGELSLLLGRPPIRAERAILTDIFRQTACIRAAATRAEEDLAYAARSPTGTSRKGFTVCTAYTENYAIGHICAPVNEAYAQKWGYEWISHVMTYPDLMTSIHPRQSASWYKISMLLQILDRELGTESAETTHQEDTDAVAVAGAGAVVSTDLGSLEPRTAPCIHPNPTGCAYILWIDADACVIDQALSLQQVVQEGCGADLIAGEDMHCGSGSYINAGVLLMRVSEWSRKFLKDVWAAKAEEGATAAYTAAMGGRPPPALVANDLVNAAVDESTRRPLPFWWLLRKNHTLAQDKITEKGSKHYFFVRQFEQSAIQKVLKQRQQGLESCYRLCAGSQCVCSVPHLRAFHTFSPLNAHLCARNEFGTELACEQVSDTNQEQEKGQEERGEAREALLGRKLFANVCVLPSHVLNSCVRPGRPRPPEGSATASSEGGGGGGDGGARNVEEEDEDEEEEGEEEEEQEEEKEGGKEDTAKKSTGPVSLNRGVAQQPARFIYHPAGKKRKESLLRAVLEDIAAS